MRIWSRGGRSTFDSDQVEINIDARTKSIEVVNLNLSWNHL
jgi:hypothetical protein